MTDAAVAVAGAWTTDPSRLPDELSSTFRAVMGWGGVAVWDESVDIVDLTREFAARTVQECCGQCFPCRIGMHEVADILEEICAGKGTEARLERALELSRHVAEASRCDLGRTGGYAVLESLEQHYDRFAAAVAAERPISRGVYASTVVAPCMAACPAGVDIPAYVEQLRIDEVERSADAVRRRCPMPGTIGRVCVRPCEDACRRGSVDEPVAIRTLKRFVADSEAEVMACPMPGQSACGHHRRRPGRPGVRLLPRARRRHQHDLRGAAGGRRHGRRRHPRLPSAARRPARRGRTRRVPRRQDRQYNFRFGVDATMDQLFEQGYEAVFVAVGAHQSARMGCEGEDAGYEGFMPGVEFLREIAFGKTPLTGKTMLVIGGGNVAMDCVRSARRIGFDDVKLLYRRTEAEMPADQVEIAEAKEEGVEFVTLVAPTSIMAEDGKVTGLECRRMQLGEPDSSGRRRPEPVEGSEFVIACDCIVPAIGQVCGVDQLVPSHIEVSKWKTLEVDPLTMQSADPRVFGGGDCYTGPSSLVAALAAGRRAAASIDEFLKDKSVQPPLEDRLEHAMLEVIRTETQTPIPFSGSTEKLRPMVVPPEVRIQCFDEVEGPVSAADARREAERCLRCYRIAVGVV